MWIVDEIPATRSEPPRLWFWFALLLISLLVGLAISMLVILAALSLFLASNNARRCSGREYFVDAGWYGA